MRCAEVERALTCLLEGPSGFWQRVRIRIHLLACKRCRTRFAVLKKSQSNLSAAMQEAVDSPDLADSVMAMIGAEVPHVRARAGRAWVPAVAAASALAVLAVCIYTLRPPRAEKMVSVPVVRLALPVVSTPVADKPVVIAKQPDRPTSAHVRSFGPAKHGIAKEKITKARRTPVADIPDGLPAVDPVPVEQPSYVVVVRRTPVIRVCQTNPEDGSIHTYSRTCRNGYEELIDVSYKPSTKSTEDQKI